VAHCALEVADVFRSLGPTWRQSANLSLGHCMLLVRLLTEIAELGLAILLEATGSAKPLRGRCNQVAGGRTHAGLIVSERQRQFSPPIEIAPLEDQTVL
jgi:hypothetical protein